MAAYLAALSHSASREDKRVMSRSIYLVSYTVTGPVEDGPTVISTRPKPVAMGNTFSLQVDLEYARSRGMDDYEAARRIVAIAHPGYVKPEQVTVIELEPVGRHL